MTVEVSDRQSPEVTKRNAKAEGFEKIKGYVREGLQGFQRDPADSLYQKGFEAALVQIDQQLQRIERGK